MAGMLPGVECARRRRIHQCGGSLEQPSASASGGGTRRSSFCLYSSNHETHHAYASSRSVQGYNRDVKLGGLAREAKERLDEKLKLRTHMKSDIGRSSARGAGGHMGGAAGNLQTEVFGQRRDAGHSGSSRMFRWAKLSWKSMEQEECAVCLETFKVGEALLNLPCAHRFHSRCLVPWLESNSHCPCCRMAVSMAM